MTKEEQEIIESTKEFAKAHNIHYDQMTENMILNAMREQLLLHNVSQQRELLNSLAEEFNDSTHTYVGQRMIEKILKEFNCG